MDKTCENIVCNPPYMRFQKFLNRDKVLGISRQTRSKTVWLYKYCVCISAKIGLGDRQRWTSRVHHAARISHTGYGAIVKRRLIEDGHLVAMINFECEKDIFPDATTSVGIVLYDAIAVS